MRKAPITRIFSLPRSLKTTHPGFLVLLLLFFSGYTNLHCATSVPGRALRFGIVAEGQEAKSAEALLTVELSSDARLSLLERTEIERVYREQKTSASTEGQIRLGQLLGAEGLLFLDVVREQTNRFLRLQLLAVKPGILLSAERVQWPPPDINQWVTEISKYLSSYFPKLEVAATDAVPISVVALRSAINSTEAREAERLLTQLAIERLSREKRLFVLERQRMQELAEEKDLAGDDTQFWRGKYLLEGTIDQRGYAPDQITLDAVLRPPDVGEPRLIHIKAVRTNLVDVINQLSAAVNEALKLAAPAQPWAAGEESKKFFEEAQWALKWGLLRLAQSSADSAWALGRNDAECAGLRVRARLGLCVEGLPGRTTKGQMIGRGTTAAGTPIAPPPSETQVAEFASKLAADYPLGLDYRLGGVPGSEVIEYAYATEVPEPRHIPLTRHALDLYYEFSRTLPPDEPKPATDWYRVGLEAISTASHVLNAYHFVPTSQHGVRDELAELRSVVRSTSDWLSSSEAVRGTYYVGDRIATHDELAHSVRETIFAWQAKAGSLWQDTPDAALALYRQLISSPVFCYLHKDFWLRELGWPRLAAWSETDRGRIPGLWRSFLDELATSTNVLLRCEGMALEIVDARSLDQRPASFTNLLNLIVENRRTFAESNVDLMYLSWGLGDLAGLPGVRRHSSCEKRFAEVSPIFAEISNEYWSKTLTRLRLRAQFVKQVNYLKTSTTFEFGEFSAIFRPELQDYSPEQAAELRPLIADFKSNVVVRSASGLKLRNNLFWIDGLAGKVESILNPSAVIAKEPARQPGNIHPASGLLAPPANVQTNPPPAAWSTNTLLVRHCHPFPETMLKSGKDEETLSDWSMDNPRIWDKKLLLDLRYSHSYRETYKSPGQTVIDNFDESLAATVLFNPRSGEWQIIPHPSPTPPVGRFGLQEFSETAAGLLFVSGGNYLRTFEVDRKRWETLPVPWQKIPRLTSVNNRLFAANDEAVFEIGSQGDIRILAASRRRPAVSLLDSLPSLAGIEIFGGPQGGVYAAVNRKVFHLDREDWREAFVIPMTARPQTFADGVLFRRDDREASEAWLWRKEHAEPELCFTQRINNTPAAIPARTAFSQFPGWSREKDSAEATRSTIWQNPMQDSFQYAPATMWNSNILFFIEHAKVVPGDGWTNRVEELDGMHGKLVCFRPGISRPLIVPMRFDPARGQPPLRGLRTGSPFSQPSAWIATSADSLVLAHPEQRGIWTLELATLETALLKEQNTGKEPVRKE